MRELLEWRVPIAVTTFGELDRKYGESLCYRRMDQGLFVTMWPWSAEESERMGYVFVGNVPDCGQPAEATRRFPEIVTPRGLRIGDSTARLLSLYGEPETVITAEQEIGVFSSKNRAEWGGREIQFQEVANIILSVFVRDERVIAFAMWIAD
jgi:hypothetical protein